MKPIDLDEEEQEYRKILKTDPSNTTAWINLAKVLKEKNDLEGTMDAYENALKIEPENPVCLFEYGVLLIRELDNLKSEEIFRKLLQIKPDFTNAWYNLAIILLRNEDIDGAIEAYRKILDITPDDIEVLLKLGVLYQRQQRDDDAEKLYKKAIEFEPNYLKAYQYLAWFYEEKENANEAVNVYLSALKVEPFNTDFISKYYRVRGESRYLPSIVNYTLITRMKIGEYIGSLIGNIQSKGQIQYTYIFFLHEKDNILPKYILSLEKNALSLESGSPSHFMCAFEGTSHLNLGFYEDEISPERFFDKAANFVVDKFKITLEDQS